MKKLIIVGAGGHGAELDEYLALANAMAGVGLYQVVGFLDDNPANYSRYKLSAPLLGGIGDHQVVSDCYYLMGIASVGYKKKFAEELEAKGADFITFIHPTAYVSPTATLGRGVVIGPMVNIGPNVKIGDFTLINSRASMGHDVEVGRYNFICPNVCFSGFTSVGDFNLFGINSATIPSIRVGSENKIAAGMVLDKHVGDNEVVFFRYKEKVIALPK